jgi:hypothetical protein
MRALSKRRGVEMQPLALDEVVRDVISLVHREAVKGEVTIDCILQHDSN